MTHRIAFIPDTHHPFHAIKPWQLMLRALKSWKPHRIVIAGDFLDCYSVSAHSKDPSRVDQLDVEIGSANLGLDELDALGAKDKHYICGNHEHRLQRYLHDKAPALAGSLSLQQLLRLKQRGWTWTPYMSHLKIGKLHLTHECGNCGPMAHQKAREAFGGNVVIGHTHHMAVSYAGNSRGESHVGAMFGWLGDPTMIDYMHRVRASKWQHGFGIGHMLPSGVVHLQAVPIVSGVCVVDGKVVR